MNQASIGFAVCGVLFMLAAMHKFALYVEAKIRLLRYLRQLDAKHRAVASSKQQPDDYRAASITSMLADKLLQLAKQFGTLAVHVPFPHTQEQLVNLLEKSGLLNRLAPRTFAGLKALFATTGFTFGACAFALGLPLSEFGLLLMPLAGFMAPDVWLNKVIRNRQDAISSCIPDFLDAMSITLQAGVSLDHAMEHTGGMFDGPLPDEIFRLQREIELGVDRDTAWKRLLERNSAPDLQKLAKAVLQGAKLGVPLSDVFQVQAADCRRLRIERAKQRAAKASPKITLVTTLIMAPAVFIMILGLLLLNVFYNPAGLGIEWLFIK